MGNGMDGPMGGNMGSGMGGGMGSGMGNQNRNSPWSMQSSGMGDGNNGNMGGMNSSWENQGSRGNGNNFGNNGPVWSITVVQLWRRSSRSEERRRKVKSTLHLKSFILSTQMWRQHSRTWAHLKTLWNVANFTTNK